MSKLKIGAIFFIFLLALTVVSAQNQTAETFDGQAYSCLKTKVEGKCSSLSTEEKAFSLLALADNAEIQEECRNALGSQKCWPDGSCNVKDTAIAVLALASVGADTGSAQDWLISQNVTPSNLNWYLQIDASDETSCDIKYRGNTNQIVIGKDKEISGFPGRCLTLAKDDYWMEIREDCLDETFEISCDNDFISTLVYKKPLSDTWHIFSEVESSSAGGTTKNTVNSFCFSSDSECDYEANLWAVLALEKAGVDVSPYLPYLLSLSLENRKYFPDAFIYYLTNSEENLGEIVNSQNNYGYWDFGEKGEYYDTALALFAISDSETEQKAKNWLEDNQDGSGCWDNNNIRNTAFLLWAGWPKTPAAVEPEREYCRDKSLFCISKGECDEAGGEVQDYICSGLDVCCDKPAIEKTCDERGGIICPGGKTCDESTISTSDTDACCLGTCTSEEPECEQYAYVCRTDCLDDEEITDSYACGAGDLCCKPSLEAGGDEEGGLGWIWILIILIVLVILGIIFRKKLKAFLSKIKGKFKKGKVSKTRPKTPPTGKPGMQRRAPPRGMPQGGPGQRPPAKKPPKKSGKGIFDKIKNTFSKKKKGKKDEELEKTLKELKEISG